MKTPEKLLYKIYIDSSERNIKSVILSKIENGLEIEVDKITGDIDIVSSIKKLLDKHKILLEEISEFVPNLGPGSFTGLKMGVTAANVLNWACGKKNISELSYPEYGREPNISKPKNESLVV